mgnify:CR=1 FL=1
MWREKKEWSVRQKTVVIGAGLLVLVIALASLRVGDQPDQTVMSYAVASQVIAVDPGHGGFDPGAFRENVVEKDITLAIGKRLARDLSQAGAAVIMLRENNSDLAGDQSAGKIRDRKRADLARRVRLANQAKADLFVSIHTNADPSPRWCGPQTFYQEKNEASKRLALFIQEELNRASGNNKRRPQVGKYFVLNNAKMTAVIVEVGFISNPGEAQRLMDSAYQSQVAYAIFQGIARSQTGQEPGVKLYGEAMKP